MRKSQTKSRQRVADHGEVFTAEREVNAMLDLVKQETERIDSRFLEPACGDGNFLAEILRRKLSVVKSRYGKNAADYERYAVIAVSSIYGVDILQDNVDDCRNRMLKIFDDEYTVNCKKDVNDDTCEAVRHILKHNILCGDALTLKQADGEPIIFAEWSAVNGCLIKRRDFELSHMLEEQTENLQFDLFGGKYETDTTGATVLKPIREYAPTHYRSVQQYE
jgi:SAM-dependent methyltransferase